MTEKLKTASVLAFERKLSNSDGLMYAGNWSDKSNNTQWQPIISQEKSVRGTISNRLKADDRNDPVKLNAKIQNANLQKVDAASLPQNCDTLKLVFTLRILGDVITPCTCNNPDYQAALAKKIQSYIDKYQFTELSNRYAENIANARCLWRNRLGVEAIKVNVTFHKSDEKKQIWEFDATDFKLREFTTTPNNDLTALAKAIREGFLSNTYSFFTIETFVKIGNGQEVFPSQELVLDSSTKKGRKSKYLYHVSNNEHNIAAMHSQKIGNALRTIDTWYPQSEELGPIAIEPYGSVTNRGVAYRQPKAKTDFYSLLDGWILKDKPLETNDQHYVVACLIRGGVFGATDKGS
jgi:CRISPR-associated protein Csy3